MLRTIESDTWIWQTLRSVTEFDVVEKSYHLASLVRLASGAELDLVAGDAAGGVFFLVGAGEQRPLLHATSEGSAGLIGQDLATALATMIAVPNWRDLVGFSGGGDLDQMRRAQHFLQENLLRDFPNLDTTQARLVEALGLALPENPVATLQAAVAATEPRYILVDADDEAQPWDLLFGEWTIDRLIR